MNRAVVVAIDGPAGAGKSTIARRVAEKLGFVYIDTGAMYRAVALWALRIGLDLEDHLRLEQLAFEAHIEFGAGNTILLNGDDVTAAIRQPEVSDVASKVSAVPGVRRAMVFEQRRIAESSAVVMEGRDIGTVVFPDAAVKVFLDADPAVRAERRAGELAQKGQEVEVSEIEAQIRERDYRDATRPDSPMVRAPDASLVDTSNLTLEEAEDAILKIVRSKLSNGKDHRTERN